MYLSLTRHPLHSRIIALAAGWQKHVHTAYNFRCQVGLPPSPTTWVTHSPKPKRMRRLLGIVHLRRLRFRYLFMTQIGHQLLGVNCIRPSPNAKAPAHHRGFFHSTSTLQHLPSSPRAHALFTQNKQCNLTQEKTLTYLVFLLDKRKQVSIFES